jgi:porin
MKTFWNLPGMTIIVALCILAAPVAAFAYDINEKFTIDGNLTGVYQYADTDISGIGGADRGAAVFDLGMNFHPTGSDEFQLTLGFGAGNGLNYLDMFSIVPYADDLEDDLKDINGRNRDYLLEAWYRHLFSLSESAALSVTGGIIDSTAYIDDNAFANDETGQFMNEVFVNHKNVNLPSYDLGGVVEFEMSNVTVRVLAMNTKYEREDGDFENYNYFAAQVGYRLETSLGVGNYRLYGYTTNDRFDSCRTQGDEESLQGFGISADQELGEVIGVFTRVGWQNDDAVIDHDNMYSGGLNVNGILWGRDADEIGIGYGYLNGADESGISYSHAVETYLKMTLSDYNDITFDVQYIKDVVRHDDNMAGFIYGVRMNAYF